MKRTRWILIGVSLLIGVILPLPFIREKNDESPSHDSTRDHSLTKSQNRTLEPHSVNQVLQSLDLVAEGFYLTDETLVSEHHKGWKALRALIFEALKTDESATIQTLANTERSLDYTVIGAALRSYFSQQDSLTTLLEYFPTLDQNPTLATPLLAPVVLELYASEPAQVLTWLGENSRLSGANNALQELGRLIGKQEPPQQEIEQVLAGNLVLDDRASFLAGAMSEWVRRDLHSAFDYISNKQSHPEFDRALYNMIGPAAEFDPESAMLWAEEISDATLRKLGQYEAAQLWRESDNTAYEQWLATQEESVKSVLKN